MIFIDYKQYFTLLLINFISLFYIMTNEESHRIVIDIPKPRTYKFTSEVNSRSQLNKSKETKSCSRLPFNKFSFLNQETLSSKKLKKTHLLLPFKFYSKVQDIRSFKQRINCSVSDRYKIEVNDFYNRIHTVNPKNDVVSVTNIDKEFFTYINERRLENDFAHKSYKKMLENLLRIRHTTGYATDCILNFQINKKNELRCYDLSVKRFTDQVTYLDIFISEDYQKSMKLLGQWEKLKVAVDLKVKELQNLGIEKFTIMSRLISLDSVYSIQQKYGRFLYYLSPPSWRIAHRDFARSIEIEQQGFDLGKSKEDDAFDVLFAKLYGICYSTAVKPVLYFTKPSEIIDIFNSMEEQQLYYFTHVNYLAPFISILNDKIQLLKDIIVSDNASIIKHIKSLKYLLKISEDRCFKLEKKFHQILHGLFFESTAATDVLKLNFNLQFCFERIFGEKAIHMDTVAVAKTLEKYYMDYSKALDTVQSNTIRCSIEKYAEKERMKLKRAKNAKTELRLFYRLEQQLLQTYNFQANDTSIYMSTQNKNKLEQRKKTVFKTQLHKRDLKENKDYLKEEKDALTEAELEYLTLFTEWTKNEDPAQYLQGSNLTGKSK